MPTVSGASSLMIHDIDKMLLGLLFWHLFPSRTTGLMLKLKLMAIRSRT
jgi:hypothetical protein